MGIIYQASNFGDADLRVFFVSPGMAQLKIFFVPNQDEAGWQRPRPPAIHLR